MIQCDQKFRMQFSCLLFVFSGKQFNETRTFRAQFLGLRFFGMIFCLSVHFVSFFFIVLLLLSMILSTFLLFLKSFEIMIHAARKNDHNNPRSSDSPSTLDFFVVRTLRWTKMCKVSLIHRSCLWCKCSSKNSIRYSMLGFDCDDIRDVDTCSLYHYSCLWSYQSNLNHLNQSRL